MLADVPIDTVTPELSEVTLAPVKLNTCVSKVSVLAILSASVSVITGRNTVNIVFVFVGVFPCKGICHEKVNPSQPCRIAIRSFSRKTFSLV